MSTPALEILAYESTPLGVLCLRRRGLLSKPGVSVTEVTLDHEFLMSSYLTESERSLARIGLEWNGAPARRVLIGGLGLGYTALAALEAERVVEVEVVEYLPQVIDWQRRGLTPLAEQLAAAERLRIVQGDIYRRLAEPPEAAVSQGEASRYDAILIDVDHSPADTLDRGEGGFYTAAGLRAAQSHLAPGGVLGVWSYAEDTPFAAAMRRAFDEVRIERVTVHNDLIDQPQTDWLFFGRGPSGSSA